MAVAASAGQEEYLEQVNGRQEVANGLDRWRLRAAQRSAAHCVPTNDREIERIIAVACGWPQNTVAGKALTHRSMHHQSYDHSTACTCSSKPVACRQICRGLTVARFGWRHAPGACYALHAAIAELTSDMPQHSSVRSKKTCNSHEQAGMQACSWSEALRDGIVQR